MSRDMPLKQKLKLIVQEGKHILAMPDMDQADGEWDEENAVPHKCCFGARLARAFCAPTDPDDKDFWLWDYKDGQKFFNWFMSDSGLGTLQAQALLFMCGAWVYPFGTGFWSLPVEQVLQRLLLIEQSLSQEESSEVIHFASDLVERQLEQGLDDHALRRQLMDLAEPYYERACQPVAAA